MGISEAGRYDATGEVRFAVVLSGGVSLAIYMNGIVQELLQLVRATAPAPDDDGHLWWADDELPGAGPVYRKLGCLLDRGVAAAGVGGGPVRTRFVVDIVTGTSAGGINGVFLAKALATDRDIAALSDLWVREGDIDKLLNDAHAADGVSPLKPQRPPASLLSGQRMLYLLLKALDGVSRARPRPGVEEPSRSPYANQIDLWVTATDLQGRPATVQTWNPERLVDIREASHRTTFHFRYDATSQLTGDDAATDRPGSPTPSTGPTTRCWPSPLAARPRSRPPSRRSSCPISTRWSRVRPSPGPPPATGRRPTGWCRATPGSTVLRRLRRRRPAALHSSPTVGTSTTNPSTW